MFIKKSFKKLCAYFIVALFATNNVYAGVERNSSNCTDEAIAAAEAYDPGSSTYLTCLNVRQDFKVVVAWNSSAINGKIFNTIGEKVGQQVVNVRNLVNDYKNNYNMVNGKDYKAVVVAYGSGVDWLTSTTDQSNKDIITALQTDGIKIYACQNTMKSKGLKHADLLPGVGIVPSGVSAVVDFQNQRYVYLNP